MTSVVVQTIIVLLLVLNLAGIGVTLWGLSRLGSGAEKELGKYKPTLDKIKDMLNNQ